MMWASWSEFFSMGGYGVYVWGSYGMTLICIVGELFFLRNRRRTSLSQTGLTSQANINENSNETTS